MHHYLLLLQYLEFVLYLLSKHQSMEIIQRVVGLVLWLMQSYSLFDERCILLYFLLCLRLLLVICSCFLQAMLQNNNIFCLQSIKTIPKQQIGKRNVNDRGQEVDHTEKITKSSIAQQPQAKEALEKEERFEKIVTENLRKILNESQLKRQNEEMDKKIAEMQSQNKKTNYIAISGIVISGAIGIITWWILKDSNKIEKQRRQQEIKTSPQTLRKERIKLFTEENLNITEFENQIHNRNQQNSTRKQLKDIVDEEHIDGLSLLQVVTGLPGNGKSTQLKRIVKELRKEGHIVYYVNLCDDYIYKTERQAFLEAEQVVSYFLDTKLDPTIDQKVFLFIDDINMIQRLQEDQGIKLRLGSLWINLAAVSVRKNFKAIVISSSSSYMDKLQSKSYVVKGSKFHTIRNKTTEQMSQSVQNMLDFYLKENSGQYQSVKRHLIGQRYTLRNAIEIIKKIRPSVTTEKEFLKELQTQENEEIEKRKFQIYSKLKQNFKSRTAAEKQNDRGVLAEIIKMKQFDGTNGCLNIVKNFSPLEIDDLVIQNTKGLHNYLEQENLLFFCFPRSERDRRIVQGLLDILKDPQDK